MRVSDAIFAIIADCLPSISLLHFHYFRHRLIDATAILLIMRLRHAIIDISS